VEEDGFVPLLSVIGFVFYLAGER